MTDDKFLRKLEEDAALCGHFRMTSGDMRRLYVLAGLPSVECGLKEKFFHVRTALIAPLAKQALYLLEVRARAEKIHAYRCPNCEGSGLPDQDVYENPAGPCHHCDGEGWKNYAPCERTYGPADYFEGTLEEVEAWARGPEPEADMIALVHWRQDSADQWGEELLGKVYHHFTSGRSIPEEHQAAHAKFQGHPHQVRLLRKILRGLGAY